MAGGITPALVVRYFGPKLGLFREAIEGDLGAEARAAPLLALISGTRLFRRILPLRSYAGGPDVVLVTALAAELQRVVDGEPEARRGLA